MHESFQWFCFWLQSNTSKISTYMLKIAKTHKHARNMQKCPKNVSKYVQNAKDPGKIPKIHENAQKLQIPCKIAAKSRQTLPRSSTTSRNGAGMLPRPLSDAPKSLQNPSKIEDSWHESFLGGEKQRFMAWIFFFWGKKTPLESPERVSPAKIPSKTLPKSMNFGINFQPSNQLCRKCGFW